MLPGCLGVSQFAITYAQGCHSCLSIQLFHAAPESLAAYCRVQQVAALLTIFPFACALGGLAGWLLLGLHPCM
jgi:hypothetical protein